MANLMLGQEKLSTAVEIAKKSPIETEMTKSDQNIGHITQKLENVSVASNSEIKFTDANILKKGDVEKSSENSLDNSNMQISTIQNRLSGDWHKNMPGCYPCFKYNNCSSSNCRWCTTGFCHNGPMCSNIYAQYIYYKDGEENIMKPNKISTIKLRGSVGIPCLHKVIKDNKSQDPSKYVYIVPVRCNPIRAKCASRKKNKKKY